jgi:hypothetical protein
LAERRIRATLLACLLLSCAPAPAAADWYFTPFIGYDFGASTTLVDLEYNGDSRTKVTFGGSAALLVGIFGVEADYAYVPGFFENPEPLNGALLLDSHVQTLTGNFILAAPLSLTRESLRPYVVVGVGWMDAVAQDIRDELPVDSNLTAFNVGGGAIGMLGTRTGLRFDLRRFTNLDRDTPTGNTLGGSARLSFWRATVGLTFRY